MKLGNASRCVRKSPYAVMTSHPYLGECSSGGWTPGHMARAGSRAKLYPEAHMLESVDPRHLLLIGAGPGVGASVVRRFGREGFRSTLISRGETLEQLAPELRSDGLEIEAVGADIEDLDGYRATLERIFRAPGAPGVAVYNAALPDPGEILDTTVGRLRTAYDVDVLGAVIAAQVAAPVLRTAGTGTLLFTSGGSPTIRCPHWRAFLLGRPPCARRRP